MLSPGRLLVTSATTEPLTVNVTLTRRPSSNITVAVAVPRAWDGSPVAAIAPAQLLFTPDSWDSAQAVALQPMPVCEGDYHVVFNLA